MIRKKWIDGEAVLSVETEDEFWKATTTGEPVELTHELAKKIRASEAERAEWHDKPRSHTAVPRWITQSGLMVVSLRDTRF